MEVLESPPGQGHVSVSFVASIISVEAVKRASYMMMDRVSISFDIDGDRIICALEPLTETQDLAVIERDFRREVLDQDLRMTIESRTDAVRSAILGLAFSRTGLQDG